MDPLFQVHMLNETGKAKAQVIAQEFHNLLLVVTRYVPAGRELSIVKHKLEEACFYAKKGMAMQSENQVSEI